MQLLPTAKENHAVNNPAFIMTCVEMQNRSRVVLHPLQLMCDSKGHFTDSALVETKLFVTIWYCPPRQINAAKWRQSAAINPLY